MLPHSLSVVVTSFTKGISAEITTSSLLQTHRHVCKTQIQKMQTLEGDEEFVIPVTLVFQ